jgi:predicted MFS family arabinose efflux permease
MNSRLLVLCFGNFIIGTGTLIVPGMLPALAHGLGVNVPVAVTAIQAAAQFTVLSFLVPSFKTLFNASPETTSILLVAFGATGVAGNIIGARMVDRIGAAKVTLLGIISMLTSHVLWLFVPGSWLLLVAFLLLWGIGCFSTNSAQQARLVMLSPSHAPVSVAMNSSAMYFGQAVGTAAGAAVLAGVAGPFAYTALALISVPLFVVSIVVSLLADRRKTRTA